MSPRNELLCDSRPLTKAAAYHSEEVPGPRAYPLSLAFARQTPLFVAYATSSPGRGKSFLKGRAFQRYSSQIAVAPQGTTPPVAETGRPISSQEVFPPKRGTSVVLSIYSMTAGDRPVV